MLICWLVNLAGNSIQIKKRNYTICATPYWSIDSAAIFICQNENFNMCVSFWRWFVDLVGNFFARLKIFNMCVSFWRWLVDLAGNSIQRQYRNYTTCAKPCWSVDSAGNFFYKAENFNMCVEISRWFVDLVGNFYKRIYKKLYYMCKTLLIRWFSR